MEIKDFPAGRLPGSVLIDNDTYHADTTRISSSGIKLIGGKSPAHYKSKYIDKDPINEDDPTEAQKTSIAKEFGSISHCCILEPLVFEKEYMVLPKDAPKRPTKAQVNAKSPTDDAMKLIRWWAEFDEKHAGKKLCANRTYSTVMRMQDEAYRNPAFALIMKEGEAEQAFLFKDAETEARCKVKPDWGNPIRRVILDYKTARDASELGFGKDAAGYGYDQSGTLYLDGIFAASGVQYDSFIFAAQEKEPPYAMGMYYLTEKEMDNARIEYRRSLALYQRCLSTGYWPAYSQDVMALQMPNWHFRIKADSYMS